jgi:o-succinylbenzoate---CoA ligase
MSRTLRALPCPPDESVLDVWAAPLAAALDGSGPALVPVPQGPAGGPVAEMAQLNEPVENGVALVVPTSGSTGIPKGALLSATALRASGTATSERIGGPGRWLLALPVTHIAGLQVLLRSILAGTRPVVQDLASGFDPAAFVDATSGLGDGDRRYTSLVPTQLARLLDAGGKPVRALQSFDAVLLGGAAAPPALLHRAERAGVRVLTTYGMSETSGGCVYDGVPLDGVRVRLDGGEDAVGNGAGRIRLGGDVTFAGYRLRPDLTREALVEEGNLRWHLTRDLGRWTDGRLEVLGRVDDLIVTGAEKVAPLAVEAALTALDPVRDAAVIGAPDPEWGQRVAAVVVPADPDRPPTLDQLRAALRDRLPAYALPRQLRLVDALPLLASGKPDRGALRAGLNR